MITGVDDGAKLFFCHNRIWHNGPDPVYVKECVPLGGAEAYLSWVTITRTLDATSIYYDLLSEERLEIFKRSMPSHTLKPRPVDLFERKIPRI